LQIKECSGFLKIYLPTGRKKGAHFAALRQWGEKQNSSRLSREKGAHFTPPTGGVMKLFSPEHSG
jgi:hypothetical protein